jgi:hypothetical protein
MDGISTLVKIIGQPWTPQKDLFTKFCCHTSIQKLKIWVHHNIKKLFGYQIVN